MQKWRLIALVAVMAAILVAGGLALLRFEPSRVTRANYRRIDHGMTRAAVEQILGPPTWSKGLVTHSGKPADVIVSWNGVGRRILLVFMPQGDRPEDATVYGSSLDYDSAIAGMIDPY
jgi:hypothetical protein